MLRLSVLYEYKKTIFRVNSETFPNSGLLQTRWLPTGIKSRCHCQERVPLYAFCYHQMRLFFILFSHLRSLSSVRLWAHAFVPLMSSTNAQEVHDPCFKIKITILIIIWLLYDVLCVFFQNNTRFYIFRFHSSKKWFVYKIVWSFFF